ncbi:uncharacterized protein [Oscarella lobularis]|uniref:uncharacterized protein n=1 Tax=Oscarella lobularis TaxID=121494 RepID=UPI00331438C6
MKVIAYFGLFFSFIVFSESVQRSAIVGEPGSNIDLFALRGDTVTLRYFCRLPAQSVLFGWFIIVDGVSTSLSGVSNPARFTTSVSGPNATLEFNFDATIQDGASFRPVATVIIGSSSSSTFAGSVTVKLGVLPKLGRLSEVVIAEGEQMNIAVNVIEGRPNPNVTFSNTTPDQSSMFMAVNSTHYQIRKMSTSISDGGVYRVEAMNAVGRDSINFIVTVHFLRLLDCDLCDVKNGSIVNCNFSSSSEPKVKLDNQLVEVVGFDNYSYVVPVPIRGQPRQLMISNGYSSPILVECIRPVTTVAPSLFTTGKKVTEANEITFQSLSPSKAEGSCERNEGYIAAIAVLSVLLSAALIGILIVWIYMKRGKRKEDPISAKETEKEKDVEMHSSSLYQDASKLTRVTETRAKGSAAMAEYASIPETK